LSSYVSPVYCIYTKFGPDRPTGSWVTEAGSCTFFRLFFFPSLGWQFLFHYFFCSCIPIFSCEYFLDTPSGPLVYFDGVFWNLPSGPKNLNFCPTGQRTEKIDFFAYNSGTIRPSPMNEVYLDSISEGQSNGITLVLIGFFVVELCSKKWKFYENFLKIFRFLGHNSSGLRDTSRRIVTFFEELNHSYHMDIRSAKSDFRLWRYIENWGEGARWRWWIFAFFEISDFCCLQGLKSVLK